MPAKKKRATAKKQAKRRVVAVGAILGKTAKEISTAAGCSPRHAARIANEPETQYLITEALRPHQKQLDKLAYNVLKAIEGGLKAKKSTVIDHFTRLKAAERWCELAGLAQGGKPAELPQETGGLPHLTWEEFVILYGRRVVSVGEEQEAVPGSKPAS